MHVSPRTAHGARKYVTRNSADDGITDAGISTEKDDSVHTADKTASREQDSAFYTANTYKYNIA